MTKTQTTWDLDKLFYKGINDPLLKKDANSVKRRYSAFAKKYKGKATHLNSENALLATLDDYEKLREQHKTSREINKKI